MIKNCVKKSASKYLAKIKRLHIPAKAKAPVSLTSPDRIKLTLQDEKLKSAHPLRKIYDMAIQFKKSSFCFDHDFNENLIQIFSNAERSHLTELMKLY